LSPNPSPPLPLSPPTLEDTDDSIETCDEFICFGGAATGLEWYVLFGGLALTLFIVAIAAYSKIKVGLRGPDIASVLLAAGDAFSDIAFTVKQLASMSTTGEHVVAALLLLFLLLPCAAGLSQIIVALRLPQLDADRLKDVSTFYAFIMLVALTNMELLRILPWREGAELFDGLPDKRLMLRIWLAVTFLEDVPQLAIQTTVLAISGTSGVLGPLSIGFSVTAMVWRGLRKAIFYVPSSISRAFDARNVKMVQSPDSVTDPSSSALDEPSLQAASTPAASSAAEAHGAGVELSAVNVETNATSPTSAPGTPAADADLEPHLASVLPDKPAWRLRGFFRIGGDLLRRRASAHAELERSTVRARVAPAEGWRRGLSSFVATGRAAHRPSRPTSFADHPRESVSADL
jgi:hypothetical protein